MNVLQFVADRTGGTLNAINRLDEMAKLYALVAADLRTLYTIEYQPGERQARWQMATNKSRSQQIPT